MIQRLTILFTILSLMFTAVSAQELLITDPPQVVRPGKTERFSFESGSSESVGISLLDVSGGELFSIFPEYPAVPGVNHFVWNGYGPGGVPVDKGTYALQIRQGDYASSIPLNVGDAGPAIQSFSVSDAVITPGAQWKVTAYANMAGELSISLSANGQSTTVAKVQAQEGDNTLVWDGTINGTPAPSGTQMIALALSDEEGVASNPHYIGVAINDAPAAESTPEATAAPTASPQPTAAPMTYKPPTADTVAAEDLGSNYWTLPVGKWDEQAIWDVMMQPITVVNGVTKQPQKETYKLRLRPDASLTDDNIIGEITGEAQGVNVLETLDNGWSLVEIFNSSYGPDCDTRPGWGNTDELIKGYVETDRLEVITPRTDYGLLIDKHTQRLHIFREGKMFSELVISTGIPTKKQPWNETPSGEFLMVSRTGGFWAGNLYCDMAMRINGGALIHEVPYILNEATNYKDYSSEEAKLGTKASHGCIRVQRKKNDDGLNMTWLWNNIKVNTKVLVWDDMPGRFTEYPDPDLKLFFNPVGGSYYHLDQNCSSIKKRWLPLEGSFTYAEIVNAEHQKLTPCKYCNPPLRKAEIDAINKQSGF